jgi:molybdate transport system ATP-binding protein
VSLEAFVVSGLHASVGLDRSPTRSERVAARRALQQVGLAVDPERPAHELSYGQRRLALFARALILEPEALLLDEPLTGLDAPHRRHVQGLLSSLARAGVQLLLATHHDADLVPEIGCVLELSTGTGRVRERRAPHRRFRGITR